MFGQLQLPPIREKYLLTPRELYKEGITTKKKAEAAGLLGVWNAWNLGNKILVYPGVPTIPITIEMPYLTTPTFTTFPVPALTPFRLPTGKIEWTPLLPVEVPEEKGILEKIPWMWVGAGLLIYFLAKK